MNDTATKEKQTYHNDDSITKPLVKYNARTGRVDIINNRQEAINWLTKRMSSRELSHRSKIDSLRSLLINNFGFVDYNDSVANSILEAKRKEIGVDTDVTLVGYVIKNMRTGSLLTDRSNVEFLFDTHQEALRFLQQQLLSAQYNEDSIFYESKHKENWKVKPVYDLNKPGNHVLRIKEKDGRKYV